MSEVDTMVAEMRQHYLNCWRDTLNQLNSSSDAEVVQSCKNHLSNLISEDWFTDGITGTELDEIETALA